MPPPLIEQGCIQILGDLPNSVVYAVDTEATPGCACDTPTVLKGWAVWYKGEEPVGPVRPPDENDRNAREEAAIYNILGQHPQILEYIGLEVAVLKGAGPEPKAWALRLERAPGRNLRQYLREDPKYPPSEQDRLKMALQFAEGLSYIHSRGVVWNDVSTENALVFDEWTIKLCDFDEATLFKNHGHNYWRADIRCNPPRSEAEGEDWLWQYVRVSTAHQEIFALGSAIYEIVEWKIPYGSDQCVSAGEVKQMLMDGKWPEISGGNPAEDVIRHCWAYKYDSAEDVVKDLKKLLEGRDME